MDESKVIDLLNRRIDTDEFDSEPMFDEYILLIIKAFGDNERDIINFFMNSDKKYHSFFFEFYEEIIEKFPSDEMEEIFDKLDELCEKRI